VLPAPTVDAMPAAEGMADDGASSEKKPKKTNGIEEPPAKMVAPARGRPINSGLACGAGGQYCNGLAMGGLHTIEV